MISCSGIVLTFKNFNFLFRQLLLFCILCFKISEKVLKCKFYFNLSKSKSLREGITERIYAYLFNLIIVTDQPFRMSLSKLTNSHLQLLVDVYLLFNFHSQELICQIHVPILSCCDIVY